MDSKISNLIKSFQAPYSTPFSNGKTITKCGFDKKKKFSRSFRSIVALSSWNAPRSSRAAGSHGSDIPLGARGSDVASGSDVVFDPGEHGRHGRKHGLHRGHGRPHRRTVHRWSRSWAWSLGSRRRELTPLPPIIGAWWRGPNLPSLLSRKASPLSFLPTASLRSAADHPAASLRCLRLWPKVPPSSRSVKDLLFLRIFGIEIGFNVVDKKFIL